MSKNWTVGDIDQSGGLIANTEPGRSPWVKVKCSSTVIGPTGSRWIRYFPSPPDHSGTTR